MTKNYESDRRVIDPNLETVGLEIARRTYPQTKRVEIVWIEHFQLFSLNIYPHPTDKILAYLGINIGHDQASMQQWLKTTSSVPMARRVNDE